MTQPGETDGYTAADHVDALHRHGMAGLWTWCWSTTPPWHRPAGQLCPPGRAPVIVDDERLKQLGVRVVRAPVAAQSNVVRHDSARLAQALMRVLR